MSSIYEKLNNNEKEKEYSQMAENIKKEAEMINANMNLCSICLTLEELKNITIANCGHKFHSDCLRDWRVINDKCPLCRSIL